jgi:membrane protease YdiL (CAAX protease family)
MDIAVMVLGFVAEVIAWSLVARGRNVWTTMTPVLATMGVVALVVGPIAWSPDVAPGVSLAVGLGLGVLLYVATRIAMVIMSRWGTFRRHSLEMYRKQGGLSLGIALLLSIALSVPGEELFWRGFFQGQLASSLEGRTALAAVSWRTCPARTSRSRPAPWSAARPGSRWRGGRAGCSRASPATSFGRG